MPGSSARRRRPVAAAAAALAAAAGSIVTCVPGTADSAGAASPSTVTPRAAPAIGLAPATRQPDGVDYVVDDVQPGHTVTDAVTVSNAGSGPATLLVNAVDGETARSTGAVYANRGEPVTKAGTWVSPSEPVLTLAPGSSQRVAFTVQAPSDATPGDHLAGLAFQSAASSTTHAGSLAVTTVTRSVIGVLVEVPGAALTKVAVDRTAIQALAGSGTAAVGVRIANVGQKLVKPSLVVTLAGPDSYLRAVSHRLDAILPSDTVTYRVPWPDPLAPGGYTVRATLTAPTMSQTVFTGHVRLGSALAVSGPAGSAPASGGWSLPVPLAALEALALVVAVGALWYALRRRRRGAVLHRGAR